ncbi:uncharacterized protein LOC143469017 [Clavelina lepadiformis]|uniref:uncharacterized protein LOC143469017 n=1 Tax=Clavelina lepadiformis TaxID=159417 RepID=UPI004041C3DB
MSGSFEVANATKDRILIPTKGDSFSIPPIFFINMASALVALYFVIVLILYEIRQQKNRQGPKQDYFRTLAVLNVISAVSLFAVFFTHSLSVGVLSFAHLAHLCGPLHTSQVVMTSILYYSWCLILWFRQRSFYTNRLMRHLTTKMTRTLSYLSVLMLAVFLIGYSVGSIVPVNFALTNHICGITQGEGIQRILFALGECVMAIFHALMSFLFFYPLNRGPSKKNTGLSKTSMRMNKVLQWIKRYQYISGFCAFTDLNGIWAIFLPYNSIKHDILIICVDILTFLLTHMGNRDWMQRLFPWAELLYKCLGKGRHKSGIAPSADLDTTNITPHVGVMKQPQHNTPLPTLEQVSPEQG